MPKYLVRIVETQRFDIPVEASSQQRAEAVAWEVFPSINESEHDSQIVETLPLLDDEGVDFDETFLPEEAA